jgi:FkbM family methyltransferase
MNKKLSSFLAPARLTDIVDIGANPIDGDPPYKKMLAASLCRVMGFEPQLDALENLNKVKTDLETYLPYVIGTGGRKTLHRCKYSGWTSLFEPDEAAINVFPAFRDNATVIEKIPVDTRPLDSIAEIKNIDFLKLDVQGSELDCLKSGIEKISSCVFIQLEISFVTLYKNQPGFGEVDLFLREMGFIPHCFAAIKQWPIAPLVINNNPTQPLNQLLEADLVYVKNFIQPSNLTNEQLKQMALIAHHCFGSFDLAAKCIELLESRGVLPNSSVDHYVSILANVSG